MMRKTRRWKYVAAAVGLFAALVYVSNSSLLADPVGDRPYLIAHRGVAQQFAREGLTGKTCTAARMLPPEHEYLENTIPGIQAAFDFGADMVEFDVHRTIDDRFAVFHDWTVDCRTEGSGVTRDHTLADLQQLDIGHGYTADGGKNWPFRGKGVGMMPSLAEVLARFPDRDFIIDIKGNDRDEGRLLAERLAVLIVDRPGEIAVYGGPDAVEAIEERLPGIRSITRPQLKRCLKKYIALGWTGHVPEACRETILTVPANIAPWLWGWPNRLQQRMDAIGTRVVLLGDYDGAHSQGFDDPGRFRALPANYSGGIWTDRIDLIGPEARR